MSPLEPVFKAPQHYGLSALEFILSLLKGQTNNNHYIVQDLLAHSPDIFSAMATHPLNDKRLTQQAREVSHKVYLNEIQNAAAEVSGWHFGAYHATTKQLEDFSLEKMKKDMEGSAPHF